MNAKNDTGAAQLKLSAVLDIGAAEGLLANVRSKFESSAPIRFDASAVETLTLPCAQIILSAVTHAQATIDNPSPEFIGAFDDLGLKLHSGAVNSAPSADASVAPPDEPSIAPALDLPTEEIAMTKRILTIDDSKTIRDMLRLTLLDAGFDVLQAVDGEDGVQVLGENDVDIVITDINMPKMDGYGVIRHIRAQQEHKHTPILVLTTESELEKRNIAREAGATGWMVKPFDPEKLIATINKVAR